MGQLANRLPLAKALLEPDKTVVNGYLITGIIGYEMPFCGTSCITWCAIDNNMKMMVTSFLNLFIRPNYLLGLSIFLFLIQNKEIYF